MIGYYLALAFGRLLSYMPFFLLYRLSDFLAWLMSKVLKYRQEVIDGNLKRSFPEKDEAEERQRQ